MTKVLTIAGSDCSGGAGIQADIKTMTAHKVYAMSVITALTAQNTTGVHGIVEITPEFVGQQLDCIFTDIIPDAVKIGMLSNTKIIDVVAGKLKQYHAKNIVLDPVMVSTSGNNLLNDNAIDSIITKLFPLSDIITPNISEVETLCNVSIKNTDDMLFAAKKLSSIFRGAILIKGGHLTDSADDLLYINNEAVWFNGIKINNPNTHGTGCTLSSAIACNLAKENNITQSVKLAKEYISGALKAGLDLGRGHGPLNHFYHI